MKVFYCIACGRRIPDKREMARYEDESICRFCWVNVSGKARMQFSFVCRTWKSIEKAYDRGERVDWLPTAQYMAKIWSGIRLELQVTPEAPAGLRKFLGEIGFEHRTV